VQQHLRAVLGDIGTTLLGGEAYINFKPELIDAQNNVTDESVRTFLKTFIDSFATLAGKLAAKEVRQAA
jgi:chromate reductase